MAALQEEEIEDSHSLKDVGFRSILLFKVETDFLQIA
jgi:hypothetical protein